MLVGLNQRVRSEISLLGTSHVHLQVRAMQEELWLWEAAVLHAPDLQVVSLDRVQSLPGSLY